MASTLNDIEEARQWSINQIAKAFRLDRRTVTRRLENGGVAPAGLRHSHPVYDLADIGPALFGQVVPANTLSPEEMAPKDQKDWYQAQNERLKYEQTMGQLVPVFEVHQAMSKIAKSVTSTLDILPDILERDCGLKADALNRIQEVIDAQREQLYQHMVGDEE